MLAQQGAQARHLLIRNEREYATTRIQILAVLCPTLLKTDGNTSSKRVHVHSHQSTTSG